MSPTGQYPRRRETDEQAAARVARLDAAAATRAPRTGTQPVGPELTVARHRIRDAIILGKRERK